MLHSLVSDAFDERADSLFSIFPIVVAKTVCFVGCKNICYGLYMPIVK